MKIQKMLTALILLLLLSACGLETKTLDQLYSEKLKEAEEVVITRGDGKKIVLAGVRAQEFLSEVKKVAFIPKENQEKGVGYTYLVSVEDDNGGSFSFTDTSMRNYSISTKPDLTEIVGRYWDK